MFVACSTNCFSRYPLERALRAIQEMEFTKYEMVISERGPHLKPSEVVADIGRATHQLRVGPGLAVSAITVEAHAEGEAEFTQQIRAVCRLARQATAPLVTFPAAAVGTSPEAEEQRLKRCVRFAEEEGIIFCVPTRIGTLTEDPDIALELCERVPGLGITLDPSHFIAGPHQGKCYDGLFPYVRHLHLRDTGRTPNHLQVRVGQGQVEYGRIVAHLSRFHYDRLLTVDIRDVPDSPFPVEPEVRKLKFLLESLV